MDTLRFVGAWMSWFAFVSFTCLVVMARRDMNGWHWMMNCVVFIRMSVWFEEGTFGLTIGIWKLVLGAVNEALVAYSIDSLVRSMVVIVVDGRDGVSKT